MEKNIRTYCSKDFIRSLLRPPLPSVLGGCSDEFWGASSMRQRIITQATLSTPFFQMYTS